LRVKTDEVLAPSHSKTFTYQLVEGKLDLSGQCTNPLAYSIIYEPEISHVFSEQDSFLSYIHLPSLTSIIYLRLVQTVFNSL
jgi:hypothetical protein